MPEEHAVQFTAQRMKECSTRLFVNFKVIASIKGTEGLMNGSFEHN